jgi:asparagine synthase (glutamine-hydrolysing)
LAHIDCDWYEHVKYCLNFIRDAVSKYGVIVVDDYSDWPGCRRAVDEFLSENDNMILEIKHTHAIILKT